MPEDNKDKVQIAVYQLDRSLFPAESTFDETVDSIITDFNSRVDEENRFQPETLTDIEDSDVKVKVFFASKLRIPKWRPFLSGILPDTSPLLKGKNIDASFIAFIGHKDHIFAISGGQGNFTVQEYVNANFGLDILTRLIQKDSKVIKSLQDRGVTGSVLGSTKFFRGDHKLTDEDQFGKIYKLIKAGLTKETLMQEFGFPEAEAKKAAGCLAKTSFQINKAIDFQSLLRIVKSISTILERAENFSVNRVILLSNRGKRNKELIKNLDTALIADLYAKYQSDEVADYDFCHKDFEKYLTASKYVVMKAWKNEVASFSELESLTSLFAELKTLSAVDVRNVTAFGEAISTIKIKSFDADDVQLTQGSILEHVHGEILLEGKTYFLIDGSWYQIHPGFIDDLNRDLKDLLTQSLDTELIKEKFDLSQNENIFNAKFIGKEGHITLDRVILENIEICDVMEFAGDDVNLIHVKKGFNNSIRELASQVLISAKRLQADIKSDSSYLDGLETKITSSATSKDGYFQAVGGQTIPAGGLKGLFQVEGKRKRASFCLAFVDDAASERDINNVEDFQSNIAKFSLIELAKDLRKEGVDLKIIQLKRI